MHHRPASEVEGAELVQEAAVAPNPVRQRIVDERRPEQREEHEGGELLPLGESAGDERRGNGGEHHLEEHERLVRDRRRVRRIGRRTDPAQAGELEPAEEPSPVGSERQGVAEQHPLDRHEAEHDEALHQRGERVLLAHHSAVEERQPRRGHEEHQRAAHEHPRRVALVDHRSSAPATGRNRAPAAWRFGCKCNTSGAAPDLRVRPRRGARQCRRFRRRRGSEQRSCRDRSECRANLPRDGRSAERRKPPRFAMAERRRHCGRARQIRRRLAQTMQSCRRSRRAYERASAAKRSRIS